MEELENKGMRISHELAYEKSCLHHYVAGTIEREVGGEGLTDPLHFGGDVVNPSFHLNLAPVYEDMPKGMTVGPFSRVYSYADGTITFLYSYYKVTGKESFPPYYTVLREGEIIVGANVTYVTSRTQGLNHWKQWWDYYVLTPVIDALTNGTSYRFARRLMPGISSKFALRTEIGNPLSSSWEATLTPQFSIMKKFLHDRYAWRIASLRTDHTSRDEAIYRALDGIAVSSINPIELLRDILNPREFLESFAKPAMAAKSAKTVVNLLKLVSGVHLWWRYFINTNMLTLRDIKKIVQYVRLRQHHLIREIQRQDLIGRGEYTTETLGEGLEDPITQTFSAKVCYRPLTNSVDGWLDTLNLLGFTPRLSDLWDIVPYSFVLDWIVPVDKALDRLEINGITQRMPLVYGILGRKVSWYEHTDCESEGLKLKVRIRCCRYERRVVDTLPDDMWFGKMFSNPLKQLTTGGALLFQYSAK
jgi:hypothetical protein